MTTVSDCPQSAVESLPTRAAHAAGRDFPLGEAIPWVCRATIAPRIWQEEEQSALWLESNGSEGCYGGWELLFSVTGQPGDEWLFELTADATGLTRGTDELVVEAFWYDVAGAEVNWDPVLLDQVAGAAGSGLQVRFAKALRYPARATRLGIRCGLRWSPRGRVRWHGWRLRRLPTRQPRTLRLGVASSRPAGWVNAESNIVHYVGQCRLAGEAGVDLLCLPETILTWGSPSRDPDDVHAAAVPVPGPWLEPFQAVARAYRMGMCFSVYERAGAVGEVVYNTALLLGRDGQLIGTYRKVHLAIAEVRRGVTAGHEFPVYDFDGVQVGMAICMDSSAAETARILAQQGAEVMLMPIMGDFRATRWVHRSGEFDTDRWKLIQRAHAFDNHLYTVVARNVTYGSAITAPWGEILAYNDGNRDVIWADVNVDERRSHPLGASVEAVLWSLRRPYVYAPLTDMTHPVGSPAQRGHLPAQR